MGRRFFLVVAGASMGVWAMTPFAAFLARSHPVWSVIVELLYPVAGLLLGMALAPTRRQGLRTRQERMRT